MHPTSNSDKMWEQQAYIKAPNADSSDYFGRNIGISGDTLVIGAIGESSSDTGPVNGTSASLDNSVSNSGAVYIFVRSGSNWIQQAYIKSPNSESNDRFGFSVAVDGDTLVVGSPNESSNTRSITNGTGASSDNSAPNAGAVYVYKRNGGNWAQEAYLKASNADSNDQFGQSVAIQGDAIVVGASGESSNTTVVFNNAIASSDNSKPDAGAAYVFRRNGNIWHEEAYLKAPNSDSDDEFGISVSISLETIVVGARNESSSTSSVMNGSTASSDNSATNSGAAYVYTQNGGIWIHEAYLKASNANTADNFGNSVAISGDLIVVGAYGESSNLRNVVNGTGSSSDNSANASGAAYAFRRSGNLWSQEAFLKASNADTNDFFGITVAVSGSTIVVGASQESSSQSRIISGTSFNSDNSASSAGAAYVFRYLNGLWEQETYLKASNADANDEFGLSIAINNQTISIGSYAESSNSMAIINGSTASSDNTAPLAGAAYVYFQN